jgi:transcriptional regulator with XRE-family HTH domain
MPPMAYTKPDRLFLRKFGLRLRQLREAVDWSQEDFAEHCNLHRTYVGSIERGERNVAILNIRKIAAALGLSMSKLLEGVS